MVFNSLGAGYCLFSALHLTLLVLGAVVAGLYGTDISQAAQSDNDTGGGRWIFAVVVAVLSSVTAALYLLPFVLRFMAVWIWDLVIFVLWISVFGVFAKVRHPYRYEGIALWAGERLER